jgi:hypothetical protein
MIGDIKAAWILVHIQILSSLKRGRSLESKTIIATAALFTLYYSKYLVFRFQWYSYLKETRILFGAWKRNKIILPFGLECGRMGLKIVARLVIRLLKKRFKL